MTTISSTLSENALQLAPYIFFYGRCEEALEFYAGVFGGTYQMQRMSEGPMADQAPPGWGDKVMHASFSGPGFSFMASDGREGKTVDPEEGNISLTLTATAPATGDRIFSALGEGGTVTMPLADAFWGGRFGIVQDRFGIEWMISTP